MASVRSKGNKTTEMKLMQILRENRITGWRRNWKLLGNPDFVFPEFKLAVFVDGCFWHGCPKHLRMPSDNQTYWLRKIERNERRDKEVVRGLRAAGWRVLRIWEHELSAPGRVATRLKKALRKKPKKYKQDTDRNTPRGTIRGPVNGK